MHYQQEGTMLGTGKSEVNLNLVTSYWWEEGKQLNKPPGNSGRKQELWDQFQPNPSGWEVGLGERNTDLGAITYQGLGRCLLIQSKGTVWGPTRKFSSQSKWAARRIDKPELNNDFCIRIFYFQPKRSKGWIINFLLNSLVMIKYQLG